MSRTYTVLENFIVLEGLDGSGTTTQLALLEERIKALHVPFFSTFEPTKNTTGTLIREILKGEKDAHPDTVAFLFAADRNEHLYHPIDGILIHLFRGELVICDRYLFSSLAYQSVSSDYDFIYSLNRHFPLPAFLFFLDTPVDLCMQRLSDRKGREIFENREFQENVLKGYRKTLDIFKEYPLHIHQINGTLPREKIFSEIWEKIESLPIVKK
ncbi:MAG: dTMP kinase [Spirochaetales bacterium]|nr:dTMP kinase [Spirochaetales bacterium]